jgi:O-antigen ligase
MIMQKAYRAILFGIFALVPFVNLYVPAGIGLMIGGCALKKHFNRFLHMHSLLILILFSSFILSCVTSSYLFENSTHRGFPSFFLWIAFFFTGYVFSTIFPDHNYSFLFAASVVLVVSTGLLLILYLFGLAAPFQESLPYRLNFFGLRPFRLGVYSTLGVFCFLGAFLYAKDKRNGILCLFCALFLLFIIGLANYRGVFASLAVALALFFLTIKAQLGLKIIACSIIASCAAIYLFMIMDHEKRNFIVNAAKNPYEASSFQSRIPIWYIGMELFKESPFFGHGYRSYERLHGQYIEGHRELLVDKFKSYEIGVPHAHNLILTRLADFGAMGTTLFTALLVVSLISAFRAPPGQRWLGYFFLFYFLTGILDDPFYKASDAYIFLLMGLTCGMPRVSSAFLSDSAYSNKTRSGVGPCPVE